MNIVSTWLIKKKKKKLLTRYFLLFIVTDTVLFLSLELISLFLFYFLLNVYNPAWDPNTRVSKCTIPTGYVKLGL